MMPSPCSRSVSFSKPGFLGSMTLRDSGRLSNSQDTRVGQPFQADVRLDSQIYVTDVAIVSSIPGGRVFRKHEF